MAEVSRASACATRMFACCHSNERKYSVLIGPLVDEIIMPFSCGHEILKESISKRVSFAGKLTLNYVRRCFADIDLSTLKGTGYLGSLVNQPDRDSRCK